MRERNIIKTINETQIPHQRQLSVYEWVQIKNLWHSDSDNTHDPVLDAFKFGYAIGHRGGLADAKKKKK